MNHRITALVALFAAAATALSAQTTRERILDPKANTAGIYHSYPYGAAPQTPAPKGYEPFYISHYGRHGSRWHSSEKMYDVPLKALEAADSAGVLTALGRSTMERVKILADDARGRAGDLTPRGAAEHKGIAARMYDNFPEVFSTRRGRACRIEARSTDVIRCVLSMAAFCESLKEHNPEIEITRESSKRYMDYMCNRTGSKTLYESADKTVDSLLSLAVSPERFFSSLFTDGGKAALQSRNPLSLMKSFYLLTAIVEDVDYLGVSLYDIFTDDELFAMWQRYNLKMYFTCGPSPRFGHIAMADAKPLLRNIIDSADAVIEGRSDLSATLRFGHDVCIVPLVALMGIEGAAGRESDPMKLHEAWSTSVVTPMATNLQLIFYRSRRSDEVLVKILHNEKEVTVPLDSDLAPYYRWSELKSYLTALL